MAFILAAATAAAPVGVSSDGVPITSHLERFLLGAGGSVASLEGERTDRQLY